MYKKSYFFSYNDFTMKTRQDFLDIRYTALMSASLTRTSFPIHKIRIVKFWIECQEIFNWVVLNAWQYIYIYIYILLLFHSFTYLTHKFYQKNLAKPTLTNLFIKKRKEKINCIFFYHDIEEYYERWIKIRNRTLLLQQTVNFVCLCLYMCLFDGSCVL